MAGDRQSQSFSRRTAMIYDPTGHYLTNQFVKETTDVLNLPRFKKPTSVSIRVEGMACEFLRGAGREGDPRYAWRCLGVG